MLFHADMDHRQTGIHHHREHDQPQQRCDQLARRQQGDRADQHCDPIGPTL